MRQSLPFVPFVSGIIIPYSTFDSVTPKKLNSQNLAIHSLRDIEHLFYSLLLQIVFELIIKRVKPASLSQIDTQIMTTVLDYLTVPVHTSAENGSIRYFTVNALKWVIVLVFISAKQYLRTVVPPKMHHDGFILQ